MKLKIVNGSKTGRGRGRVLRYGQAAFSFGKMTVALDGHAVCWIGFNGSLPKIRGFFPAAELIRDQSAVEKVIKGGSFALVLYGTEFQTSVWKELLKIKCGKTVSYQDIARAVGRPGALRAVGSAVGSNPVSVIVPCHRVINKSGKIDKYAWGADVKRRLLQAEGAL